MRKIVVLAVGSALCQRYIQDRLDNGFEVSDIRWGDTLLNDVDMCAINGKLTPRQKAPNHRRPEKRLRKSK